jgi:hypothetical protein
MAFVPTIPPRVIDPDTNSVRAAYQIAGRSTWVPRAQAVSFLLGKGGSLVIGGPYNGTIAAGSALAFHFYYWPRKQNQFQLWTIGICTSSTAGASGTVEIPSGTEVGSWQIDDNTDSHQPQPFTFQRTVASPTSSPSEITINVTNDSTSDTSILVTGICGYELPRYELNTFTASSMPDEQSCYAKAPIYAENADEKSVNGVAVSAFNALDEARRSVLFSWAHPFGVVVTAAAFPGTSNVFLLDPSIVARHLYNGTNTASVAVAVFAKMVGSTPAGDVKITAQSGGTVTLHFTSTSATWVTGTLTVETEDLTRLATDGGLRGGSRETLKIEARKTAGTNITIYGICIGEA